MAIGDRYEASLLYSLKGEKCANVLRFQQTQNTSTVSDELDLGNAIKADLWPAIKAASSDDLVLQIIRVRRYAPTAGGSIMVTVDEAGSISEDSLPSNNCVVITMYSESPTKNGRGRIHLPGIPDTHNQDGLLPASVTGLYEAISTVMEAPFIGPDLGAWLYGIGDSEGATFHPATNHQLRSWLHTLRGRRAAAP